MKLTSKILTLLLTGPTYTHAKTGVRGGSLGGEGATHGRNLRALDEACIAAVGVVDYEDNSEETFLACELSNGNAYKVPVVGPDWIKTNMKNGQLKSGKTFLNMPGAMIDEAKGEIITNSPPGLLNNKHADRDLRELATVGTRSVLVVRVIAGDGSTSIQESGLSESVFNDPVCLASQYDKCSQGQLQFVAAASRSKASGQPATSTDISSGVTTVTVSTSTSAGDTTMRNDITSALNAQFGVTSPSQLATHVMYCLPANTMSGIAYAYINSWNSVYSNEWCTYVSGQMHEIGHNLGLAHSNEGTTSYADQSGLMGYSYGQDDGPEMCFNGAKLWQLGWFSDPGDALELNEADLPATLNLEGFVTANSGSDNGKVKVVKINTPVQNNDLFMVFNWKSLHNIGTIEGGNQVTIVRQGAEGNSYSESWLLAKLSNGNSYTENDFFGTGKYVTVAVTSLDITGGTASVTVSGVPVDPPTPAPTGCTVDADCDDGDFCTGIETCSPEGNCVVGSGDPCVVETSNCGGAMECDSLAGACVEVGDGICDFPKESCGLCAMDCKGLITESGSVCGNGKCEDGEDCTSCPGDCAGVTGGKPSGRYCCAGGPSGSCDDDRCKANGFECIATTSDPVTYETCCGDGVCNGNENTVSCPYDCDGTTPPPTTQTPTTQGPTTAKPTTPPSGCEGGSADGTCGGTETCLSCPEDCSGVLSGKPVNRFCCVGPESDPSSVVDGVDVSDSRC